MTQQFREFAFIAAAFLLAGVGFTRSIVACQDGNGHFAIERSSKCEIRERVEFGNLNSCAQIVHSNCYDTPLLGFTNAGPLTEVKYTVSMRFCDLLTFSMPESPLKSMAFVATETHSKSLRLLSRTVVLLL